MALTLSDQQIQIWKKEAARPNYGSLYFSPKVVAQLIEELERARMELIALQIATGQRAPEPQQQEMFGDVS